MAVEPRQQTWSPGGARAKAWRLGLALVLARVAASCSRILLGRSGRTIAGRVLLIVDPTSPASLSAGRSVTLVTGTNGKSTTTAMLAAALRVQFEVATNADGANTPAGLVATLAEPGRARHVVLEVDEAWLPWAIESFGPECVVLLNISRDQLHRNPETHLVARRWHDALAGVPLVVGNADDPAVVWAAGASMYQVWVAAGQHWNLDSVLCPACGGVLVHVPAWHCRGCGLSRPLDAVSPAARSALPGQENQGNAAMASIAATAAGIPLVAGARAIEEVTEVAGRYATWTVRGRHVRLILAKNPAGYAAALRMVVESDCPVLLAFNSEGVDGRDPSWLYDVDFTGLAGRTVVVCGKRGTDLAARLLLDEVPVLGQYASMIEALLALPVGEVELLANYTAFQAMRQALDHAG